MMENNKMLSRGIIIALMFSPACKIAAAASCTGYPYPYSFSNGTSADANQVNANFNNILNCANILAPLSSPSLTGTPTAPTVAPGDNSGKLATTAYVATPGAIAPTSITASGLITAPGLSTPYSILNNDPNGGLTLGSGSTATGTPYISFFGNSAGNAYTQVVNDKPGHLTFFYNSIGYAGLTVGQMTFLGVQNGVAFTSNIGSVSSTTLASNYTLDGTGNWITAWNITNGGGEMDLVINHGPGSTGGFSIYDIASTSHALTNLLHADTSGVTVLGNAVMTTGSATGSGAAITTFTVPASGTAFTATGRGTAVCAGGSVSAVTLTRGLVTVTFASVAIASGIALYSGDQLTQTYSAAPATCWFIPA